MEVPELSSGQGTQNPIHGNNPKSSFFARGNRNFTLTTLWNITEIMSLEQYPYREKDDTHLKVLSF